MRFVIGFALLLCAASVPAWAYGDEAPADDIESSVLPRRMGANIVAFPTDADAKS